MSILSYAKGVSIYDGQFTISNHGTRDLMGSLLEHAALGALFNAAERFDPPKCHPDTRTAVLDSIDAWVENPGRKSILWLSGPAGAGKSAIAQTLSERWSRKRRLGASFFFSRTALRRNVKTFLVSTISYCLASSVPGIRPWIEAAISNDIGIFTKNIQSQFDELVVSPLSKVMDKSPTPHIVIVIDGLDECSDEDAQRDILDAIASVCHNPQLPLLFLVSSRPERQLRESFSDDYVGDITTRIALDNSQDPDRDIKLFLDCKFAEIRRKNPSLDRCWPLSSIINQLVEKASGQFVYASTVVKYVGSPRRDPRRSLEIILGICTTSTQSDYPFKDLDALYMLILDTVYEESSEIVSAVLTTLIFSGSDFVKLGSSGARSPAYFDQLLLLDDGQIYHHLADMHSLLEIPHFIHRTSDIRITHASLSDFLTNPLRAGAHYVSRERGETRLAKLCFRVLLASLAAVPQAPNHPGLVVFTIRSLLARAGPSKSLQEVSEIFLATYDDEYVPTFKFKDMHLPCASNVPYNLLPMLIVATQLYLQRCASTAPRSSRLEEASPTTTVKHLIDKLLLR